MIRQLVPGDEAALEAFLVTRAESSMFLRANARAAGLVDEGRSRQGTYFAAFEHGALVGVAAHAWNGSLLVQAPRFAGELARAAALATGRPIVVLSGPYDQVVLVRTALGLDRAEATTDGRERLYVLELADLRVPELLASGTWRCRRPHASEMDRLAVWRAEYAEEALGAPRTDRLEAESRRTLERMVQERACWVLVGEDDVPRAFSAFNAMLPDVVQVGGVWTPVPERGRGLGRAVVAGTLLEARDQGVSRAILFTGLTNAPAQRAYEALGFRAIGSYGVVLFRTPAPLCR